MYQAIIISKKLDVEPDLDQYSCSKCHSNASDTDYEIVKISSNLSGVSIKYSLLSKCLNCYKFRRDKGNLSVFDFLNSLIESCTL